MLESSTSSMPDALAPELPARSTTGRSVRVPTELREAAQFPGVPDGPGDAGVWARVLVVAAKALAGAARDAKSWPQQAQGEVVAALDEVGRLAAVAKAPLLAAQEAEGAWRGPGMKSFEDFRARTTRTGRGPARREVNTARTLQELEGGLEALESGAFTPVHAERLGSITDDLPEEHKQALLTGQGAQRVKKLAERLDPTRFAKRVQDMVAALSAAQVEDAHQAARARRHLELSPAVGGLTRITGLLDPVAGHTLQIALDAAAARPAADDERTRGQRQADALQSLAEAMLAEQKTTGHARPHLLITMTAETFQTARDHLAAASHLADDADKTAGRALGTGDTLGSAFGTANGAGVPQSDGLGPAPVVRMQDGPLLPLSELGRTLCDSQIARLVIGADSEPLDLGRAQRLFTPAQRRAVIARDGGCAWDGCTTPARYGEVHHLDWWDDDHGHTNTERGVLLCVFHHHELHRHNLDLVRATDHDPDPQDAGPPDPQGAGPACPQSAGPAGPQSAGPSDLALPGDPERRRPRYRAVPRAKTRATREAATRERLLAQARGSKAGLRARRASA